MFSCCQAHHKFSTIICVMARSFRLLKVIVFFLCNPLYDLFYIIAIIYFRINMFLITNGGFLILDPNWVWVSVKNIILLFRILYRTLKKKWGDERGEKNYDLGFTFWNVYMFLKFLYLYSSSFFLAKEKEKNKYIFLIVTFSDLLFWFAFLIKGAKYRLKSIFFYFVLTLTFISCF